MVVTETLSMKAVSSLGDSPWKVRVFGPAPRPVRIRDTAVKAWPLEVE